MVSGAGQLIGVISTETEGDQTNARNLNAITTSYINRDLKAESGLTIADLLAYPAITAQNFNQNIAPKLTNILTNTLLQK